MKIIELRAENVKRLKAVDITPDGTLQVVGGRNAQGKTSVLDSIWLALGGGKAGKETSRPIRDGEEKASVTLNLGELVVTRTWTAAGTKLQVQSADGATHKSPQAMLDKLVGQLSFDPLAFTRLSARDQRDALLDLVDLDVDLDKLDMERQAIYVHRTEIGRKGKEIGEVKVDSSLPAEEQSVSQLIAEIRMAEDRNAQRRRLLVTRESARENVERMRRELADAEEYLKAAEETELPAESDTEEMEQKLAGVEETNATIRANNTARERKAQKDQLRTQYESATKEIDALDKQKADALSAAKFPVDGLAFDEHGVTYQGVPFSQASSAEQIKVSLGMGMALNPKLRVLVIKDGSLLDDDSLAAIKDIVEANDYQLWLEKVTTDEGGSAVIIEDGEVQS